MLVIDENGEKLGILSKADAIAKAEEAELDLVLIVEKANPPVAKIVDFGKYRFEKKKAEQAAKKSQKNTQQKEVRLNAKTGTHDLQTKAKKAIEFLGKGHKVKVSLQFRYFELQNQDQGKATMTTFLEMLEDAAVIEKPPRLNNRFYDAYLAPKK
ncbi:MAG: translation initiation factor IF-3 [Tenericutes bacterium]|nr:MAG: translation initiation factor IF-3 [Mycoplasmatota bacterium]